MSLKFLTAFVDAGAAWRRDSGILLPLAGVTMFLPQYAVYLLLPRFAETLAALPHAPAPGAPPDPAAQQAAAQAMSAWLAQYGIWFLAAQILGMVGALTVVALYLHRARPTLGGALLRAGALFLRYLLASILIGFAAAPILLFGLVSPLLTVALMPIAFYLLGRTMLAGPAIVAAAPIGAVAAIQRSWALTRGHGWILAATYASLVLALPSVAEVLLSLGALGGDNPVIAALSGGLAAVLTSAALLALALVQVALYRRLASKGT